MLDPLAGWEWVQMMRRLRRHQTLWIFLLRYPTAAFQTHSSSGRYVVHVHSVVPHQTSGSSFVPPAPICPWIPSSRVASAPLIAATIAFASDDSCKPGATGVIVLQGACTTARVEDVADLSACSRWSSAQCFSTPSIFQNSQLLVFCFRDLLATTYLVQIFFLCSWSRRVWVQISQRSKLWLLQRRRARYTLPRRSAPVTTVSTAILCHRSQSHFFSLGKLPRPRPSPPLSLGLTGWFRARRERDQTNQPLGLMPWLEDRFVCFIIIIIIIIVIISIINIIVILIHIITIIINIQPNP